MGTNEAVTDFNEILNYDDLPREPLVIPEWGDKTVYVRVLPSDVLDEYEASLLNKATGRATNLENATARFVVLTLCYADGKRMFNDGQAGALGKKSSKALQRIGEVAKRINGLTEDGFEELAKNSEATPDNDSGSSSPPSGPAL